MSKKIFWLVNKLKYKKRFFSLFLIILITSLLEAFGIAAIIPVISVILNADFYQQQPDLTREILISLGINNHSQFILFILSTFLILFTIKTLFSLASVRLQYSIIYSFQNKLALIVLNKFINETNFQRINDASGSRITQTINTEVHLLSTVLSNYLNAVIDILMVLFITSTVVYIGSIYTVGVFLILGLTAILILWISGKRLTYFGNIRQSYETKRLKTINEALAGIREIKLYDLYSWLENQFNNINQIALNARKREIIAKSYPRHILEFVIMLSLIGFIYIWILFSGKEAAEIIPIISIFAAASFKILPAINRVTTSIQTIKFYGSSVDAMHNAIKSINLNNNLRPVEKLKNDDAIESIEMHKASFKYNDDKIILNKIDFKLFKGQKIGIIGESGSGKSTLVNLICGLLNKSSGKILVNGIQLSDEEYRKRLFNACGYVSQKPFLFNASIAENISNFELNPNIKKINSLLDMVMLHEYIGKSEEIIITENQGNLSGGQAQRISIARALYADSEIIILDEPTSSLDYENKAIINEIIYRLDSSVIWISHDNDSIKMCDPIYKLGKGNLQEVGC